MREKMREAAKMCDESEKNTLKFYNMKYSRFLQNMQMMAKEKWPPSKKKNWFVAREKLYTGTCMYVVIVFCTIDDCLISRLVD